MPTYYISPTGNNANAGTLASPWQTLAYAYTNSAANDTIICMDGTFTFATATMSSRTIQAQHNGLAIFDGAGAAASWNLTGLFTITGIKFQNIATTAGSGACLFGAQSTAVAGTLTMTSCIFDSTITINNVSGLIGTYSSTNQTFVVTGCLFNDLTGINATGVGYFFDNSLGNTNTWTINNCTIVCKKTGVQAFLNVWSLGPISSVTVTIKNTIIYNGIGSPLNWKNQATLTSTATYDDFYLVTDAPTGTGVITSDPLFVDATNANFNLRPTSPCLGTGIIV